MYTVSPGLLTVITSSKYQVPPLRTNCKNWYPGVLKVTVPGYLELNCTVEMSECQENGVDSHGVGGHDAD
jgi:hypothetical protein